MKYCRFRFEEHIVYGSVEERGGESWIVDLIAAPEEDLAFHLAHQHVDCPSRTFDFEPMPLERSRAAAAGHAIEDRLRGPQLSRPREGTGQRSSRRAAALLQAAVFAAGAQRHGADAAALGARGL